ncbi:hypothetical protein B0H63DRAFT_317738 [Podospora didyma]|uniref:F-box domain-containing protein n=1 Tax=Podospora didyma TaxID=330526 RepID=A0AAE0K5I3_9PEZI|nr:hypothetical protein B0H63DRAFT_317738 [Podospora didyma]
MDIPALVPNGSFNPQAGSPLSKLPTELFFHVGRSVSTVDLTNLRLTCKAVEHAIGAYFAHEFFRRKQFMISTKSLQTLIDISKHAHFRVHLKHVSIATDRILSRSGLRGPNTASPTQQQTRLAHEAWADQCSLMPSGIARDMLQEAFANLPELEVVDIRDFNSSSRNRDGVGTLWRSYGAPTFEQETGMQLFQNSLGATVDDDFVSNLFSAVINALAAANKRPKNIETLLRSHSKLTECAFAIPPRVKSSVVPLLADLQVLHLSLSLRGMIPQPGFGGSNGLAEVSLRGFLQHMVNLRWLRLNFQDHLHDNVKSLLEWLAADHQASQANPAHGDIASPSLSCLTQLDLGSLASSPQTIVKLLAKVAPSLRTLSLRRMSLVDSQNTADKRVNPWPNLFQILVQRGVALRDVAISLPSFRTADGFRFNIHFRDQQNKATSESHHYDENTQVLFAKVAQEMIVNWPRSPSPSESAIDDDSDESEQEDLDEDEEEDAEDEEEDEEDDDDGIEPMVVI